MIKHAQRVRNRYLAIGVIAIAFAVFLALFLNRRAETLFQGRAVVRADFRTITGLRQGSPVQLAGVEVGRVKRIEFVKVSYHCEPLTEDVGRYGAGRTNDCDDFMFCAPDQLCGDLEPFAGKGFHGRCHTPEDCSENEICVTSDFRRHASRVQWNGPLGFCATFKTEHWRTRVLMDLPEDKLQIIRNDSRAMVAANSVLGDQLVNIFPGHGDPLGEEHRIQTRSSLYEDIDRLRERLDRAMENADDSLLAIVNVIDELKDERTIRALKGTVYNLEVITRDVAYGEGLVGALLNAPSYKSDVGLTIAALKSTGSGLETAADRANRLLTQVDRNIVPVLDDTEATLESIDQLLVDLEDPSNKSLGAKLLRDSDGQLAEDLHAIFHNSAEITGSAREIAEAIDDGDGTLGKLINDPTLRRDLGRLLNNISNREWLKGVLQWYLKRKGIDVAGGRGSARPPRPPRRR